MVVETGIIYKGKVDLIAGIGDTIILVIMILGLGPLVGIVTMIHLEITAGQEIVMVVAPTTVTGGGVLDTIITIIIIEINPHIALKEEILVKRDLKRPNS